MNHLVMLAVASLPFAYLFAPTAVANIAAFAFWVFWVIGLLAVVVSLVGWSNPKPSRDPRSVRLFYRLLSGGAILSLAATGHYAMATIMVVTGVLAWIQRPLNK